MGSVQRGCPRLHASDSPQAEIQQASRIEYFLLPNVSLQ